MSSGGAKRDRRNWKGRLKGRALGEFQLEQWHKRCREERADWRCYKTVESSFDCYGVMAAVEAKQMDSLGRTAEYRGGCFYGTPPYPNRFWHAGYGVRDIPILKEKGLL